MADKKKNMHIILRTCAPVEKSSRGGERPFGLDKRTIILKSLKSLLDSCKKFKKRIFLEIVDDSSPEEFRKKMEKTLSSYNIDYKFNRESLGGNGDSMEKCYDIAEESKYDLIYFLEDDYFHLEKEISEVFYAYDNKILFTDKFAIHPTDYPNWYNELSPSYIFIGKTLHWRSAFNTTGTLVLPKNIFTKYKKNFYSFAEFNKKSTGGEDETINKIWEKIPLISPLPSLAAHLDVDTMPFFVNWKEKIKNTKI